jgi:hypothetical protein
MAAVKLDVEEVKEERMAAQPLEGVERLNVFELIGQGPPPPPLLTPPPGMDLSVMFNMKERGAPGVARFTRFTTEVEPRAFLLRLQRMCAQMNIQCAAQPDKCKVGEGGGCGLLGEASVSLMTSKGALSLAVTVFVMAPGIYIIDLMKTKGDTLEFHKFFRLCAEQFADIITRAPDAK